jgi:hypothetical protein
MSIISQNSLINQFVPTFFIRTILDGQILVYDSTRRAFINVDPDFGAGVTSVAAAGINGVSISGSPITSTGTITVGLGAITPSSVSASGTILASNFSGSSSGTNTGDQTITLTGDIGGTGTTSFSTTLATVNEDIGTFGNSAAVPVITVNAKGLITAVTTAAISAGGSEGSFIASADFNQVQFNNLTTNIEISSQLRSTTFAQLVENEDDAITVIALIVPSHYYRVNLQVTMYNSNSLDNLQEWPYNVNLYGTFLQEATVINKSQHRSFAGTDFFNDNSTVTNALGSADIAQRVSFTDSYIVLTDNDVSELAPFMLTMGVYAGSYSAGGQYLMGSIIVTVDDLGVNNLT